MERREFIISSAAFCGTLSLLGLQGCTPTRSISAQYENGKLKIKKSDFQDGNWVVVRTERTNAPVFLSKNERGEYYAVLMLCTHKQCEVKPTGPVLSCPCHGAEFAFTGTVLKEPAEKDLQKYETSSDADHIFIHLN